MEDDRKHGEGVTGIYQQAVAKNIENMVARQQCRSWIFGKEQIRNQYIKALGAGCRIG